MFLFSLVPFIFLPPIPASLFVSSILFLSPPFISPSLSLSLCLSLPLVFFTLTLLYLPFCLPPVSAFSLYFRRTFPVFLPLLLPQIASTFFLSFFLSFFLRSEERRVVKE